MTSFPRVCPVISLDPAYRAGGLAQGVRPLDDGDDRAGLDELAQLLEVLGGALRQGRRRSAGARTGSAPAAAAIRHIGPTTRPLDSPLLSTKVPLG